VHFIRLYNMPMQDMGKREIASFKVSLDHLKIHTRKNIMSALHTFFLWFEDQADELELIHNYHTELPAYQGQGCQGNVRSIPRSTTSLLARDPGAAP
jgi:hypothetical protein